MELVISALEQCWREYENKGLTDFGISIMGREAGNAQD